MRVAILTTSKGMVTARYTLSLVNMVKDLDFPIDYVVQLGADITSNRILLIRKAQELKATHAMFIDDDLSFSSKENPLKKMLGYDKDIIGADYNFRQFPLKEMVTPLTEKSDKLYKCKSLPSGFLLIKMSVFDKIPEPWFLFERNDRGEVIVSEDVYFCRKAIKAGFDVWCDPSVKIKHVGEYVY